MTPVSLAPASLAPDVAVSLASSGVVATLWLLEQYSSSVDHAIVSSLIIPSLQRCQINWFYAERKRYYQQKK
jgi:hypothetical protein